MPQRQRYRILLAKRAAKDLEAIFEHIAGDSPSNARGMVERILSAIEHLKDFPHRTVVEGQPAGSKHPIRSLPVESYMVFFRVIDEHRVVRILRVRHGAQRRLKRYD
jgi:toxin ParE1/3/4